MSTPSRTRWEDVPLDPDPDLGQNVEPLTVIQTSERGGQVLFLPNEENQLEEDEFIVAAEEAVESLDDWI